MDPAPLHARARGERTRPTRRHDAKVRSRRPLTLIRLRILRRQTLLRFCEKTEASSRTRRTICSCWRWRPREQKELPSRQAACVKRPPLLGGLTLGRQSPASVTGDRPTSILMNLLLKTTLKDYVWRHGYFYRTIKLSKRKWTLSWQGCLAGNYEEHRGVLTITPEGPSATRSPPPEPSRGACAPASARPPD
jgi:hypothetical protein